MTRRSDLDASEKFAVDAALGRILRMMTRPSRPGDEAEFDRCRAAVLDVLEPAASPLGHSVVDGGGAPDYVRDRRRGASGA